MLCDGPNNVDCLDCSREDFRELKAKKCVCKSGYYDDSSISIC